MTNNCICDNMIVSLIVAIFNKGTDLVNRVIKPNSISISSSSSSSSSISIRMMIVMMIAMMIVMIVNLLLSFGYEQLLAPSLALLPKTLPSLLP